MHDLKFEGWIGCAAHQMQLVVKDGYELKGYQRVQAVFARAKAISTFSRKSSLKVPMQNETRWNSNFKLHEHIVKHFEDINRALQNVDRNDLMITKAQRGLLSQVTDIMQYFTEATNIQSEGMPTLNCVIPVADSPENALYKVGEKMQLLMKELSHLTTRFGYLLTSPIHQAATTFDPRVKLSFTDLRQTQLRQAKVFVFDSTDVKLSIKSLLPSDSQLLNTSSRFQVQPIELIQPSNKKLKLLDFCSVTSLISQLIM